MRLLAKAQRHGKQRLGDHWCRVQRSKQTLQRLRAGQWTWMPRMTQPSASAYSMAWSSFWVVR